MNNKSIVVIIIASIVSALILLSLGIMIGKTWQQPHFTILPANEMNSAPNSSISQSGTITIQGESDIPIKSEIAIIEVGIEHCAEDSREANQVINDGLKNITERFLEEGLSEENVIPTDFSMSRSNRDENLFCARNELTIVTDALELVSEFLDMAIEAGATNVYQVRFTVRDTSEAQERAIEVAYANAVKQAEQTAELLDKPLGEVIKSEVYVRDYASVPIPVGGGGGMAPQNGRIQATVKSMTTT
jgi:uncharacterized protein YggE